MGALLGTARSATVVATGPSTIRLIGDPDQFFAAEPQLGIELARQLAGRLHSLLAYLDDVREQYAGSDGHLEVFDRVLGRLFPVRGHDSTEPAPRKMRLYYVGCARRVWDRLPWVCRELVAFAAAFPVNRWLISRGKGHAVVHAHHAH